jgi:uncharacterized protein YqgC (DUF456 family)
MDILLSVLAVLFAVIGSIGCVIPALPGGILSFVGYLCFYFCSYVDIPVMWPIIFGALTVVAALLDFVVPSYMTKLFGGTKAGEKGAFWGSMGGCLLGFFFTPLVIIIGLFVGALVGELMNDKNNVKRAISSGLGSVLSFFVGSGIKLIVSLWITIDICSGVYKHIF